jgi:PII interaction protein X
MPENYLNHPTFGLLTRICEVDEGRSLFTTLYAQRLFFLITSYTAGVQFEPISRADAKLLVENRLRFLRRNNAENEELHMLYKRTFC